jgi:CubicO group peptidase (beta-lactamase class C family)
VTSPLGVADDLFFAVPVSEQGRMAQLEDAPGSEEMFGELPPDSPILKLGPDLTAEHANRAEVRSANILAGGTVTARAVARMYAALLGEVDRVRLISPERLREVSAVAMSGTDEIFGFPTSWGLGYSIGQFMSNAHETQHVFGVGGVGGSHAYADTKTGITFALTKNRLTPDFDTAEQIAIGKSRGLLALARARHGRYRVYFGTLLLPDANYLLGRVRLQRPRKIPRSHHPQRVSHLSARRVARGQPLRVSDRGYRERCQQRW